MTGQRSERRRYDRSVFRKETIRPVSVQKGDDMTGQCSERRRYDRSAFRKETI